MNLYLRRLALSLPLSFLAGALSCLSMSPYDYTIILIIGFSVLYSLLLHAQKNWHLPLITYFFGLGYFGFGLSWIGNALLVPNNPYRWAWPLAVSGLPIIISFYYALLGVVLSRIKNRNNFNFLMLFVLGLSLTEWLRGHLLTGFPWNLYGYTWIKNLEIAQITYLTDIYFLTFLTIFWMTVPAYIVISKDKPEIKFIFAAISAISCLLSYYYGYQRLYSKYSLPKDYNFVLVQPNIEQDEKWDPRKEFQNFQKILTLSRNNTNNVSAKTIIVWPETAISSFLLSESWALPMIKQMLETYNNAYLMTGIIRYEKENNAFYNSIITINKKGQITETYNKSHLVPFGEYIPFSNIFNLDPIVGFKGLTPGNGPTILSPDSYIKIAPAICYEIIFPHKIISQDNKNADIIINVTNDAWYGISAGPYQHLTQSIFRAIEEEKPVIRVANTGFSVLIDPYGREIIKTDLFTSIAKNSFDK